MITELPCSTTTRAILAAALLSAVPSTAAAEELTFVFEGPITSINGGELAALFSLGDELRIEYTFETDTQPQSQPAGLLYQAVTRTVVRVTGADVYQSVATDLSERSILVIGESRPAPHNDWDFYAVLVTGVFSPGPSPGPVPLFSTVQITTPQDKITAVDGNPHPLLIEPLSIDPGDVTTMQIVFGFNGAPLGGLIADLVSWTVKPTDPTSLLADLIADVQSLNLPNGIANSFEAKLGHALAALSNANENDDGAAANSVGAFMNAVDAHRGGALGDGEADQLLDGAQDVLDALDAL